MTKTKQSIQRKKNRRSMICGAVLTILGAAACVFFVRTTAFFPYAVLKTVVAALFLSAVGVVLIKGPATLLAWTRQHRSRLIRVLVLEAGMFFYLYFFVYRIKTVPSLYSSAQILFSILIMILLFLVFLMTESGKVPLHRIYLVTALSLGILFQFLLPFGSVPDEKTHLYAAYDVSNAMLGIQKTPDGNLQMRSEDAFRKLKQTGYTGDDYTKYWLSIDDPVQNEEIIDIGQKPMETQPYQYLVPALGLTVGRCLHLGTSAVFMLGRVFNMIWFILITALAIRLLPFGKMVLTALALMPMSLQQASSFSYDVFVNSTAFFLIAMTMHLAYGEESADGSSNRKYVRYIKIAALLAACVLLLPLKGYAYSPLCFLPLLTAVKMWKKNRREAWLYLGILAVCLAVFCAMRILPVLNQTGVFSAENNLSYTGEAGDITYTLQYLLSQKDEWVHVLLNTSRNFGAFYLESMIGTPLGWLSVTVNPVFIYAYVVILFFAAFQRKDEPSYLGVSDKIWINVISWGSVAAVLLGMLLAYTPISHQRLEGVQGRYFIPLAFPMLLTLRSGKIQAEKSIDGPIFSAVLTCAFFVVHFVIT